MRPGAAYAMALKSLSACWRSSGEVSQLGMEVCVTLGEIGSLEARKLKAAGVTAYNHNLDTSPEFYPEIVSTHTFQERLDTIAAVQESGMSVCCGGIIGMGETETDRLRMLEELSNLDPAPESVPINCLMPMPGTPLADQPPVDIFELVRLIAVTRIALPKARVRLAAGRTRFFTRGSGTLFFRRREFNFLRGQTSHGEKSCSRCGCCSLAPTRAAASGSDGFIAATGHSG